MTALDEHDPAWPEQAAELLRAQPDLSTERLLLRRIHVDDADAIFAYARDPEVARFTSWPAHARVEDARAFASAMVASYDTGQGANWAIVLRDGERLVGTIGFGVNAAHRSAEVGYALARPYWGRGLATEALRAVLGFAFGTLGLHRMIARCERENTASWKVMRKVGMTYEGTQRGSFYAKGRFADLMVWSILRAEK